jgi:hypothetical protein
MKQRSFSMLLSATTIAAGVATSLPVGAPLAEEAAVQTQTVSGKAYEGEHLSGSGWPEPLYSVSLTSEKGSGIDRVQIVNMDHRGRPFFTHTIDFDGECPKAYSFSNTASKQEGKVTVTPTELVMELTENGKTKTAKAPRPRLFAVGPSVSRIVERHVGEIAAGRSVAFRMVAIQRLEVFALHVQREPARPDEPIPEIKSGQWLRLRTEPESALARMFAPKISTIVDAKTGQTLFVSGPLPSPAPGGGMLKSGTIRYEPRHGR